MDRVAVATATRPGQDRTGQDWAGLGYHRRGSHRVQPCTVGKHKQVALKGKELRKLAGL